MNFKEIYKLPLRKSNYGMVFTADGYMAFLFCLCHPNSKAYHQVVDALNREEPLKSDKGTWSYKSCFVYLGEKKAIRIRGWGHLTGCGGLCLPSDEAARIQDEFGKWIADTLNGKERKS